MSSTGGRPRRRARSAAGWLAWVGLLLVVVRGGGALGRGALAPPVLADPSSWAAWANGRAPLEAAFAVLGLLVVALAWYLLAVTLLAVAARVWGARLLVSVVDVLTLPVVRRSVHAGLGIGLVGTSVAGGAGAAALDPTAPVTGLGARAVAAVGAAEPGPQIGEATDHVANDDDPPVMRMLPEESPGGVGGLPAPEASPTNEPTASEWEVRPGDHLWSVAAAVLREAGATGGDAEVAAYWLRLIEANAERLADPANPDLIFPGQVFALPVPSPPGERALP